MNKSFNRFTYIFFFFHGCFFTGNQLMVHYSAQALLAGEKTLGIMIGAFYTGSMVMVLLLGEISERVGKRIGAFMAAVIYSTGAFFISFADSIPFMIASYFLFGSGVGSLEGMWFSFIGDVNGEETGKQMNLAQAVFSVGAILSPLLLANLLVFVSFRLVYVFIGIFMAALSLFFLFRRSIDALAIKSDKAVSGLTMFRLVRSPLMLALMLVLIVNIGSETSLTYWLPNYFGYYGAAGLGATGLSLYWLASVPGRFLASRLKNHSLTLVFSFLLCILGVGIILAMGQVELKLIGVFITGMALAPVYPCVASLGASLFPNNSASAFSLMVFSCGFGGALAQPLISRAAEKASVSAVYRALLAIMLALSVSSFLLFRVFSKRSKT